MKLDGAFRRVSIRLIAALLISIAAVASCGGRDDRAQVRSTGANISGCRDCMSVMCWNWVEASPGDWQYLPNYDLCAAVPCPTLPDLSLAPFSEQVQFIWRDLQNLANGSCIRGGCNQQGYQCVKAECSQVCILDKIDPKRVSVLRGVVNGSPGTGLAGVDVSVVGDADYGHVTTEWGSQSFYTYPPPPATGRYFISVNAGAPLRLRFSKSGFLPVERVVSPAAGEYVDVPTVELVPEPASADALPWNVSYPIQAGGTGWVNDASGWRAAVGLFPPNTTWSPQSSSLTIGMREYTVGTSGPEKMPATLPPASAYTYALEIQAKDPGGQLVSPVFSTPAGTKVVVYVFASWMQGGLDFPVGQAIPSGYYDSGAGAWAQHRDASQAPLSGRVIQIVGYDGNGWAQVDTDGDGVGDNTGLAYHELEWLTDNCYPDTLKFWRVPVTHFSSSDFNWKYGLNPQASSPKFSAQPGSGATGSCGPNAKKGSIIECEPQVLGEEIPIASTPYKLVYRSSRTPGYKPAWTLSVRTDSGTAADNGALKVIAKGTLAGKVVQQEAVPSSGSNMTLSLVFDGTDAFGRVLTGPQPVTVDVGYVYPGTYKGTKLCSGGAQCPLKQTQSECESTTGCTWVDPVFGTPPEGTTYVNGNNTLQQITLWSSWKGSLGVFDARKMGFGGWTLDAHHSYSKPTETILYGWGGERKVEAIGDTVKTVAGQVPGGSCIGACFGPSSGGEGGMAFGPNGDLYLVERGLAGGTDGVVKKYNSLGVMSVVIPSGSGLIDPVDIAAAPDGKFYVADLGNHASDPLAGGLVFRCDPSPHCDIVAGDGTYGNGGDGIGTSVALKSPRAVELGPDGAVYFADTDNHQLRRLDTSGHLKRVAGRADGTGGNAGDGQLAAQATLWQPRGIAFGPDGSLYFSQFMGWSDAKSRIRRIGPDGIITTFAGGAGSGAGKQADGLAALSASLDNPSRLAFGRDGALYFIEEGSNYRIRRVSPGSKDGLLGNYVATVAGRFDTTGCNSKDGTPATLAKTSGPRDVAIDAEGFVNILDRYCGNVRRLVPPFVESPVAGEIVVPSVDGRELYVFNEMGRHLRTESALLKDLTTGQPVVTFEFVYADYELPNGLTEPLLIQVKDRRGSTDTNGLVTTIARTGDGTPQSITSPTGKVTTLSLQSGYLSGVVPPDNLNGHVLAYDPSGNGLLTQFSDPRFGQSTFQYSTTAPTGRLVKDWNSWTPTYGPAFVSLENSVTTDGWTRVQATTAMGIITKYDTRSEPDGATSRRVISPDGTLVTTSLTSSGGASTQFPDLRQRSASPFVEPVEPRFGMAAPTYEQTTQLPGTAQKKLITRVQRSVDGLSGLQTFTKLVETRTVKKDADDTGLAFKTEWERPQSPPHFVRQTTPALRKVKQLLDNYGRVSQIGFDSAQPEVEPVTFEYDAAGRVVAVRQAPSGAAGRRTSYDWDTGAGTGNTGYLRKIRHGTLTADLFTTKFVPDALGRVRQIFSNEYPNDTQVKVDYNATNSGVTVSIPSASSSWQAHNSSSAPQDLLYVYNPPLVPGVSEEGLQWPRDNDLRPYASAGPDWNTGFFRYYDDPPTGTSGRPKEDWDFATWHKARWFTYDSAGRPQSISMDVGGSTITTSYTYSGAGIQPGWDGLLFKTTTGWPTAAKNVTYTYDDYLRKLTETVSGGQLLTYSYDADSLVTSVQVGSLATLNLGCIGCRSDQSGRLNMTFTGTQGGGVVTSYGYDSPTGPKYGDLTNITTKYPGTSGSVLYSLSLSREEWSARVLTKTENVQGSSISVTYEYDAGGRLWKETPTGFSFIQYLYDQNVNKNGNRTTATYPSGYPTGAPFSSQTLLTFDAQDRISSANYAHNDEGQRTSYNSGSVTYTYTWDDFGKLKQVCAGSCTTGTRVENRYDGHGHRVMRRKYVNNALQEERWYLYASDDRLLAVYDGGGNLLQQFVYATGRHVPDLMVAGGTVYHLLSDHVGSVRLVVSTAGSVAKRVDFDAWGRITNQPQSFDQPFGFAGGLWDADAGLVLMGARWYDPVLGRWISKDPLLFMGGQANLYAYVDNDPVNFIDPWGLLKLPADPNDLPAEWWEYPHGGGKFGGKKFRHPSGDVLEWHPGTPGKGGSQGKDHWHHRPQGKKQKNDTHFFPGEEVPDPPPTCTEYEDEGSGEEAWAPHPADFFGGSIPIFFWPFGPWPIMVPGTAPALAPVY